LVQSIQQISSTWLLVVAVGVLAPRAEAVVVDIDLPLLAKFLVQALQQKTFLR
jgi:hypothetical protein